MAKRQMKRCSTLLINRDSNKNTTRYHLTLIRMMIIYISSVLKSFKLESNTLGANFCDTNASEGQDLMDEKVVSKM